MRRIFLLVAVTLLAGGCGAPNPPAGNQPAPPVVPATGPAIAEWKLSADQEKSLGAPAAVGGLEIRPPADFRDMGQRGPGHVWVGTPRPDETYPTATVLAMPLPAALQNASLETLLADAMTGVRGARKDYSQTPPERGTINGLAFIRSTWTGGPGAGARAGLQGKQFHGVIYLTVHQGNAIQFLGQDTAPDHPRSLEQLEAMAYSMRVAKPMNP